jgi:rubrerythrin
MNAVAELTMDALKADGTTDNLELYGTALAKACEKSPPPFGNRRYGDIYRTVAADPYWLAASLVTNAEREAEGATRLWSLAACTSDTDVAAQVKQHAVDESRHARWYIAMLDIVFPDAVDDSLRPHVDTLSPPYTAQLTPRAVAGSAFAHAVTLDDLVQMNIAEIRTTINQRLQRPVLLAHCLPAQRHRLVTLLDRLLGDEIRHVRYSAQLIERFAARDGADDAIHLMNMRLSDFNEITNDEIKHEVFEST